MKNNNRWEPNYCSIFFFISVDNPKWECDGRTKCSYHRQNRATHCRCPIISKLLRSTRFDRILIFFFAGCCLDERENNRWFGFYEKENLIRCQCYFAFFVCVLLSFVQRSSIVAINGQSFAIFASHWCGGKRNESQMRNWTLLANAVKKDTYEWKLITHCTEKRRVEGGGKME